MFAARCLPAWQRAGPQAVRQVGGAAGITPTVGTQLADQTLGDDQRERRGNHPAGDAHLLQARQGFAGGIGVQGGEHQMTGLGGFERDFSGLGIADLAHHDNIRIWRNRARSTL